MIGTLGAVASLAFLVAVNAAPKVVNPITSAGIAESIPETECKTTGAAGKDENGKATKPQTLFLVGVLGYVVNPTADERKKLATGAGKNFKRKDKDPAFSAAGLAGGCSNVHVELWEEDDEHDEWTCGHDETKGDNAGFGLERTITKETGWFDLDGLAQDCGNDVEPFIKIIFKDNHNTGPGSKNPESCGDFLSKDPSGGRLRLAVPDDPYGANKLEKAVAGKKTKLTDLSKVDDLGNEQPELSFYFGRINIELVEYHSEAHDWHDNDLDMKHLIKRTVRECVHDGSGLKGWSANPGMSAMAWMKENLINAKKHFLEQDGKVQTTEGHNFDAEGVIKGEKDLTFVTGSTTTPRSTGPKEPYAAA